MAGEPYIFESDPVRASVEAYMHELWTRAKMERQDRESKWMRDQLVASGEGVDQSAGNRNPEGDGGWRSGDAARAGVERIRIARDKVLTAKAIIGESVYKNNAVPFILKWRSGSPHDLEEDGGQAALNQLHDTISDVLRDCDAVSVMREAVERGASYGEYWLCGGIDMEGRRVILESPDVWTMYIDPSHDGDVGHAEYVIRSRALTPYDVSRMVYATGDVDVYDREAIAEVCRKASPGQGQKHEDAATVESGKRLSPTIEWKEIWCHVPPGRLVDPAETDGGDDLILAGEWPLVRAVMAGDRLVALDQDPGSCPYAHFIWDQDVTEPHPQGIYDAMATTQTVLTGMFRALMRNLQDSSRINLAGHREMMDQDPEELFNGAVRFFGVSEQVRDVREAVQQIQIAPNTDGIMQALEPLLTFADMESGIPRILQGQQPHSDTTAYELRNRLNSAGKVLSEVVRRHDVAITFVIRWVIYCLWLFGVFPEDVGAEIIPQGFLAFSDLVERMDGMQLMLSLAKQFDEVHQRMDIVWIANQLAQAQGLDVRHIFLSEEELQRKMQEQQAAQQAAQELEQQMQQAKLNEMNAKSERAMALARSTDARSQLNRAEFFKKVEDDDFKRGMSGQPATPGYGDGTGIVQERVQPEDIQLQPASEATPQAGEPMGAGR